MENGEKGEKEKKSLIFWGKEEKANKGPKFKFYVCKLFNR